MRLFHALGYCFHGRDQRLFCAQIIFFFLLLGGALSLWSSLRPSIEKLDVYRIDPEEDIYIWNQPEWIENDLVSESLKMLPDKNRKEEYNALDRTLVDTLVLAFSNHPWVERVKSVVISYPARVDVVLDFKKPIARVDVSTQGKITLLKDLAVRFPNDEFIKRVRLESYEGATTVASRDLAVFVIDSQGRKLSTDYFRTHPEEGDEMPVIMTYGPYNELLPQAAALAEFLKETNAGKRMKVEKIHLLKAFGETEPIFFLTTEDGRVAKWGAFAEEDRNARQGAYNSRAKFEKETNESFFNAQKKKLERWAIDSTNVDLTNERESSDEDKEKGADD